ncbi:MAG: GDSL-type esterase/lipase family protein [Thiovulaceae bacterium]|nr:GDSL-type esterase/lipase family protein [Sulfurimonadaceae bacterium]
MTKQNDLIFLGDSLTDFHDWSAFGRHHNAGISGDTTDGLLYRLHYTLEKKPKTLVLMIGINDLLQGRDVGRIEEEYAKIFEKIENINKIVLLSLLPVKAVPETAVINQNVKLLNRYLQNESQKRGYIFVDLYPLMTDKDEGLIERYTSDGVHLTPEGYRIWEDTLTPLLQ